MVSKIKELGDGYWDEYDEAYVDELLSQISNELDKGSDMLNKAIDILTGMGKDDITEDTMAEISYGFSEDDTDTLLGTLQSFSFPNIEDWCADKIESLLDNISDAKHQQFKDEGF